MSFHLHQSGNVRRQGFEVSVADFKDKASAGVSFWRGWLIGLTTGFALSYVLFSGKVIRPFL